MKTGIFIMKKLMLIVIWIVFAKMNSYGQGTVSSGNKIITIEQLGGYKTDSGQWLPKRTGKWNLFPTDTLGFMYYNPTNNFYYGLGKGYDRFLQLGDTTYLKTLSAGGTVTSVAMTTPTEIGITGSPITSAGTLTLSWASQSAYTAFRRSSGSGVPAFGSIDSNYFGGNFATQVRAAQSKTRDVLGSAYTPGQGGVGNVIMVTAPTDGLYTASGSLEITTTITGGGVSLVIGYTDVNSVSQFITLISAQTVVNTYASNNVSFIAKGGTSIQVYTAGTPTGGLWIQAGIILTSN